MKCVFRSKDNLVIRTQIFQITQAEGVATTKKPLKSGFSIFIHHPRLAHAHEESF